MIGPSKLHSEIIAAASPSRGRSIAGAIAPLIDEMHEAVGNAATLARLHGLDPSGLLGTQPLDKIQFEDPSLRVGWAICAITLIEALHTECVPNANRALAWFSCAEKPLFAIGAGVDDCLASIVASPHARALFPYLLDTYGRTSRLDVIRDESLRERRNARKEVGSFYTPADVAYFMAEVIARTAGAEHADPTSPNSWLDPATGSGVFLVAALRRETDLGLSDPVGFATQKLFGADVSPQACDFAAFAVLHEIIDRVAESPQQVWQAIRANLVALDALSLLEARAGRVGLRRHFPRLSGPMRLICNPPYAGATGNSTQLDGAPVRSLYLPFVEMAWRLADGPDDASCLVVPLALGANTTADHRRTRASLSSAGGRWTLLFFDRQPHALFGEEAKTRATIAIRRPGPKPAEIYTSGLLKWTSRQRTSILSEDRSVELGAARISRLVPKLTSNDAVQLYLALTEYRLRRHDRPRIEKAAPDEIVGTALSNDVFVGATAYNFLNIFRNYPDNLSWRGDLSSSGIHKLRFGSSADASVATALLSSRIAFWLWHTECDGFHVPSWFLDELPLLDLSFSNSDRDCLANLGDQMWSGLQEDILVSNNRTRLTFAFRPSQIGPLRDQVDSIILRSLDAHPDCLAMIKDFEFRVVSIDGSNRAARSSPTATVTKKG